jgi:glycosyl transferase family 2
MRQGDNSATFHPRGIDEPLMLSVIIPTEGVEQPVVATLAALVPGAAAGVVREVVLVDRGDTGVIERVADVAGCRFLQFEGTRAAALAAGARQARSPWLMFLQAGAVLDNGWIDETAQFMQRVSISGRPRAGIFRYARSPYADPRLRDGFKFMARVIAGPLADQGLLIAKDHYDRLGGYAPDARRSEARLLRQLGRSSRTLFRTRIMIA